MIRSMAERAIEMQRDLYICFIDYTMAFDTVRHKNLILNKQILNNIDLDGKDFSNKSFGALVLWSKQIFGAQRKIG